MSTVLQHGHDKFASFETTATLQNESHQKATDDALLVTKENCSSKRAMPSSSTMEEQSYAERGATAALERVCSLESRLRQALQNSGPLRTMFGPRRGSEERESRALQSVQ